MNRILALLGLLSVAIGTPLLAQDELVRPAKLMIVGADADGVTRQFFGQVVARQTVDLAFQVSGQIVEFPATEGQGVAEDALIAQLGPCTTLCRPNRGVVSKRCGVAPGHFPPVSPVP